MKAPSSRPSGAAGMRFDHLKTLFRSLRFRLSLWNTAAVLLIVVVTLLGVREALRFALMTENDHVLLDDAKEVVLAVEGFYPDLDEIRAEMQRKAAGHLDRQLFVRLLRKDGQLEFQSGRPPELKRVAMPAPGHSSLMTVDGFRIATRSINNAGLPAYSVQVGASLQSIQNDMVQLSRLMLAAGIVILFVAPLSGYFLAGRATRPLARIITTAARLRPSQLDERLPIRGTGDELDKLSLTINHFLDLLADYLQQHREFVDNAAHELRSPLAAVQSAIEVTLNHDRSTGEYQEMLADIADECGQLRVLVNQLLLLAETDGPRSPLAKRPVRLDKLVERSVEMFRGAAEERGVRLVASGGEAMTIEGDADRLRQVINNLIDNSLKFTLAEGHVLVTLRPDDERQQVVLRVTDTGLGIGPEDLPHVFERFYRGDKSRQRENFTSGNGLGLSICESIVLAHGGTIEVESTEGHGATFTVRLPIATSELLSPLGV
jgi:heavy metal sensor kinase